MDVEATEARISQLEANMRSRRIFTIGGIVIAASPLLPLVQGAEDAEFGWGAIFLVGVGIFVSIYGYMTNKKLVTERDKLQSELNAHMEEIAPKPKPVRRVAPQPVLDESQEQGEKRCVYLTVNGTVTGVGYRFWFSRLAKKMGLTGWVENVADDQVKAMVCGPSARVDMIVEEAAVGPRRAEVTSVDVEDATPSELTDFQIRN